MPCLDKIDYIDAALDSVIPQLSEYDELIVHDACSTDGTTAAIARRAADNPRIRHVIERDDGQADALNLGLAKAQGEWVGWLNADDVLLPGALDAVRSALLTKTAGSDVGVVIGDHLIIDDAGDTIDEYPGDPLDRRTLLRVGTAVFSGSTFIRTDVLREIGGFDAQYHFAMDLELQFRLAERNPERIALARPLGALRMNDTSKLSNSTHLFVKECWEIRRRYSEGTDYVWAVYGEAVQIAAWATLRIRLTKRYRRFRRFVIRRRNSTPTPAPGSPFAA